MSPKKFLETEGLAQKTHAFNSLIDIVKLSLYHLQKFIFLSACLFLQTVGNTWYGLLKGNITVSFVLTFFITAGFCSNRRY